jgi:diaminopimelate epimerase
MAEERRIPFFKMHGGGNDFVLIDHRERFISAPEQPRFAQRLCVCKTGVGADGLILLEHSDKADLSWRFYNADGSEAEMCGNGARCAARFAAINGLTASSLTLETLAGVVHADVQDRVARVLMTGVGDLRLNLSIPLTGETLTGHFMQVGVPHVVVPVDNLEDVPVREWGRAVRFHPLFQPAGANCNFVKVEGPHTLTVRTYERGVEDETLACGTGAVASALISAHSGAVTSPVLVRTQGGEVLTVSFEAEGEALTEIFLEGEALVVYQGELWMDEIK